MSEKNEFIIIYSTFPNKEEAEKISSKLLEEKLIACANIFSSHTAMYEWDGKICNEKEFAVIFKTREESFNVVKDRISEMHSYDCPCIVSWGIDGVNAPYSKWLSDSLT